VNDLQDELEIPKSVIMCIHGQDKRNLENGKIRCTNRKEMASFCSQIFLKIIGLI
jgi:hypothetical protein